MLVTDHLTREHAVRITTILTSLLVLGASPSLPGLASADASGLNRLAPAPRCDGLTPTIVGSPGADRLRGTSGRDVIVGLGGDDAILGLGGADVLCGGQGRDRIVGGEGRDRVLGEQGRDELEGGGGADRVLGGDGADVISDVTGADVVLGGSGNDKLWVGHHADGARISGGTGRDDFRGAVRSSTITIRGGADRDLLRISPPDREDGSVTTVDYRVGEITDDVSQAVTHVSGIEASILYTYGYPGSLVFHGSSLDDTVGVALDAGPLTAYGYRGDDRLRGSGGQDYFDGGAGRDYAFGTRGRAVCVSIEEGPAC